MFVKMCCLLTFLSLYYGKVRNSFCWRTPLSAFIYESIAAYPPEISFKLIVLMTGELPLVRMEALCRGSSI